MCEDSTTRLENLLFARCLLFGSLLFGPVFYDESAYTPKTGVMHEKLWRSHALPSTRVRTYPLQQWTRAVLPNYCDEMQWTQRMSFMRIQGDIVNTPRYLGSMPVQFLDFHVSNLNPNFLGSTCKKLKTGMYMTFVSLVRKLNMLMRLYVAPNLGCTVGPALYLLPCAAVAY